MKFRSALLIFLVFSGSLVAQQITVQSGPTTNATPVANRIATQLPAAPDLANAMFLVEKLPTTLPDGSTFQGLVYSINNQDQVMGIVGTNFVSQVTRPVIWSSTGIQVASTTDHYHTAANSAGLLNNFFQIALNKYGSTPEGAVFSFLGNNGITVERSLPGVELYGINDAGSLLGIEPDMTQYSAYSGSYYGRHFVRTGSGDTTFTLPAGTDNGAFFYGLNFYREAAGSSLTAASNGARGLFGAQDGKTYWLSSFGSYDEAYALNDAQQIVGTTSAPDPLYSEVSLPALWENRAAGITALSTIRRPDGYEFAWANKINRWGHIVGKTRAGGGLWVNKQQIDFTGRLLNPDNLVIANLRDINDEGVMLGEQPSGPGFRLRPFWPISAVSRDRFLAGSLYFPEGFEGMEVEITQVNAPDIEGHTSISDYGRHDLGPGATTVIHAGVNRMLDPDAPNGGSQSADQKVWFARNALDPRQMDFYTCFERHGEVTMRVRRNGVLIRELTHTLTPAEDFARWIDYADASVKGRDVRFRDGALASLMTSSDGGGLGSNEKLDNSTRALLVPLFLVVTQVEMLEAVVVGGFQGIKTGVKDDVEVLALVTSGGAAVLGWSADNVRAALASLDGSPLQRAIQLKRMVDGICEEYVFTPLATTAAELSTWEGFRARSIQVWRSVGSGAKSVWVFATDNGKKILPALLNWFDGFAVRMMDGGELAAFQSVPWGQDEIFQEVGATARQSAYTFGYTTGYLGEQVVAGAITGGAAVAGKVLFKETASQVGRLTLRSSFLAKAQLQHLRRTAKSALVAGVLRAEVELGLRQAAKSPLSATDKRTVAEVLEYAISRPNFDRALAGMKFIMEEIGNSPNIKKLFRTAGREQQFFHRLAIFFDTMGADATEQATKGWIKTYERLLKFDGDTFVEDRTGDLLRALNADASPAGRKLMRESLEDFAVRAEGQTGNVPFKLARSVQEAFPETYRYASTIQGQDLLDFLRANGGELPQRDFDSGWYLSFDKVDASETAQKFFQLPQLNAPKYRLHIRTSEVADDLRIPYGRNEQLGTLEAVCRDFPEQPVSGSLGGGRQVLSNSAMAIEEVWDISGPLPVRVYPP